MDRLYISQLAGISIETATRIIDSLIIYKLEQICSILETNEIEITAGTKPVRLTKNQSRDIVRALECDIEALRPFATSSDAREKASKDRKTLLKQVDERLQELVRTKKQPDNFPG